MAEETKTTNEATQPEAASDPVPVPQLNPAALMQGFFVGQDVRRNRR